MSLTNFVAAGINQEKLISTWLGGRGAVSPPQQG